MDSDTTGVHYQVPNQIFHVKTSANRHVSSVRMNYQFTIFFFRHLHLIGRCVGFNTKKCFTYAMYRPDGAGNDFSLLNATDISLTSTAFHTSSSARSVQRLWS